MLKLQQKYLTILQRYIRLVYAGDMKRFGRMLLRLPALRTIAASIDEVFEHFIISDRAGLRTLIEAALLDNPAQPSQTVQTLDQMIITSDIQIDDANVISEAIAGADIVETEITVVEHVAVESV